MLSRDSHMCVSLPSTNHPNMWAIAKPRSNKSFHVILPLYESHKFMSTLSFSPAFPLCGKTYSSNLRALSMRAQKLLFALLNLCFSYIYKYRFMFVPSKKNMRSWMCFLWLDSNHSISRATSVITRLRSKSYSCLISAAQHGVFVSQQHGGHVQVECLTGYNIPIQITVRTRQVNYRKYIKQNLK